MVLLVIWYEKGRNKKEMKKERRKKNVGKKRKGSEKVEKN